MQTKTTVKLTESQFFRMLQFPEKIPKGNFFDVNYLIWRVVEANYPHMLKLCTATTSKRFIHYTKFSGKNIPEVPLRDNRKRDAGNVRHVIELE